MIKRIICLLSILTFLFVNCSQVKGNSMLPSLKNGDYVLSTGIFRINTGDVVLVWVNGKVFVKRVIGMEGDVIKVRHSHLFVNDRRVKEEYTQGTTNSFSCVVPEGKIFLMGDNREHSLDSRLFGCVEKSDVEGKVILRFTD